MNGRPVKPPPRKPGQKAARAQNAKANPTRTTYVVRAERPRLSLKPAELAVIAYGAALADPWDAIDVGIPWGAPLPTFKQKIYRSFPLAALTANADGAGPDGAAGGIANGDHALWVSVVLGSGALTINQKRGSLATTGVAAFSLSASRLVGAAIRLTYEGRREDLGGSAVSYVCNRTNPKWVATREENIGRLTESDYYPRSVFDLSFSDAGTENLEGDVGTAILVKPVVAGVKYWVEVVALIESAHDTPPIPAFYASNHYATISHSKTPSADSLIEGHLHTISTVAKSSRPTRPHVAHTTPDHSVGPQWMSQVSGFAKQAEGFIHGGTQMVSAIAALGSSVAGAAEMLPLLLAPIGL